LDATGNTITVLQVAAGNTYVADYAESVLRGLTFSFSSPGYNSQTATGAELIDSGSNIHLEKSNTLLLLGIGAGLAYAFSKTRQRKKVGALQGSDITPVLLIAGGILGINAISKLLDKLGLGGNPATSEIVDPNSPWKPNYWRQYTYFTYAITVQQAKDFAATIHNAFSVFNDDFNAIMGVISQMRTKANVSFLSDIFTQTYNEDLLSFLGDGGGILPWDGLSKEHMQQILAYVDKLPTH
jgi:hypothetical protein